MKGADVFLGVSAKGAVTQDMVRDMADNPVIFAMANPDPEITPEEAHEVRMDAIVATGRSDYPNQVNNVLGFPYLFRGALDIHARAINDEMKIACAHALAELAREDVPDEVAIAYGRKLTFGRDYIIPTPFDPRLIHRIPPAVAKAGMSTGVARRPIIDMDSYELSLKTRMDPTASILQGINARARANQARMIFAEGDDPRVLRAAVMYQRNGLGKALVVGREADIKTKLEGLGMADAVRELEVVNVVTGVIQAGSSLGILVPPSVVLVLYAMIARQPVGQLWLAGVIPGLMMAALFILYITVRCRINPVLGPVLDASERDIPQAEKMRLLRAGLLPVMIFAVMMVPFVNGWTSLVESSAIGAMAAFLAAILKGRMTREVFENSIRNTLGITCMFMWIILAALAFGAVFDGLGAVKAIESVFTERLNLSPLMILILMQLSFILMGTFLDDTAMLVIVAPLYVPLVGALGFDLIWYGILYTITTQIAYMTPPFGYNLFLMRAMAPPEISLKDIYASITPFVLIMVCALILIMIFPSIATWLPDYVYNQP